MTSEYQKWAREKVLKNKTWIYDNVININRYSAKQDIISTVEKTLSIRIPRTITNPHELYTWLDTHE